jgi:LysM repeat protein
MGQGGAVRPDERRRIAWRDEAARLVLCCAKRSIVSIRGRVKRAIWIFLGLLCLVVLPALVLASPPAQEQVSSNLLVDGDFEAPPPWPQQNGIGEVQVAPGWRAYYLDVPPKYIQAPSNCDHPGLYDCFWMRPEFRDNTSFANRIHSGQRSQKYFSYGRMHEAGLMQQVRGIPPGARVRFSIWIQAWMCANPDACGKNGAHSDAPSDMHLRVGIDPLGGINAFTPTVVWSAEKPAWDTWVQFQVETTAISDTVTVLTHSRAEWPWARLNNDVYLDDAGLVIVGAYATLTPTAPVGIVNPTATPFPEGAVTHTLGMGETLFDVALEYAVPVSDLLKLNQITTSTELYVGQPLVVQRVTLTPTPTPLPTEVTATPVPSSTPQPTGTSPALTFTPAPTPLPPVVKSRPNIGLIVIVAVMALGFAVVLGVAVRLMRR